MTVETDSADKEVTACAVDEIASHHKFHLRDACTLKSLSGLMIVVMLVISWVLQAQFSNNIANYNFTAFCYLTWYARSWTIICYPIYCLFGLILGKSLNEMWSECSIALKYKGSYTKGILIKVLPVAILMSLGSYCYYYSLTLIPAGDFTAILSSNIALIYLLSIFWLKEPTILIRIFAVLLSVAGVVLFAYSNGFEGATALGIILAFCLAVLSSIYRVSLKVVLANASIGKSALYTSAMSICITLTVWPVVLVFHVTNFEVIKWPDLPWDNLNSIAGLGVLFNSLLIFGIGITYPIFISLGVLLGIPGNAIVDLIFRQIYFDYIKVIGALCICCGFLILLIPEERALRISNSFIAVCKKRHLQNDVSVSNNKTVTVIYETQV